MSQLSQPLLAGDAPPPTPVVLPSTSTPTVTATATATHNNDQTQQPYAPLSDRHVQPLPLPQPTSASSSTRSESDSISIEPAATSLSSLSTDPIGSKSNFIDTDHGNSSGKKIGLRGENSANIVTDKYTAPPGQSDYVAGWEDLTHGKRMTLGSRAGTHQTYQTFASDSKFYRAAITVQRYAYENSFADRIGKPKDDTNWVLRYTWNTFNAFEAMGKIFGVFSGLGGGITTLTNALVRDFNSIKELGKTNPAAAIVKFLFLWLPAQLVNLAQIGFSFSMAALRTVLAGVTALAVFLVAGTVFALFLNPYAQKFWMGFGILVGGLVVGGLAVGGIGAVTALYLPLRALRTIFGFLKDGGNYCLGKTELRKEIAGLKSDNRKEKLERAVERAEDRAYRATLSQQLHVANAQAPDIDAIARAQAELEQFNYEQQASANANDINTRVLGMKGGDRAQWLIGDVIETVGGTLGVGIPFAINSFNELVANFKSEYIKTKDEHGVEVVRGGPFYMQVLRKAKDDGAIIEALTRYEPRTKVNPMNVKKMHYIRLCIAMKQAQGTNQMTAADWSLMRKLSVSDHELANMQEASFSDAEKLIVNQLAHNLDARLTNKVKQQKEKNDNDELVLNLTSSSELTSNDAGATIPAKLPNVVTVTVPTATASELEPTPSNATPTPATVVTSSPAPTSKTVIPPATS